MYYKITAYIFLLLLTFSCTQEKQEEVQINNDILELNESKIDSFYCYAKGIYRNEDIIEFSFDEVEFMYSDSAKKAMIEDGLLTEDEFIPNDIYIRNNDIAIESLPLDTSYTILMQTLTSDEEGNFKWNEEITLAQFEKILSEDYERSYINFPFFVKTENNKIILIREQYIP